MDKPIAKKPVYYRYRWHIAGGIAFIVLLIYVGIAASGGRKLRTDAENLIIGEATSDKFLEYVDVEGVVNPSSPSRSTPAKPAAWTGSLQRKEL